MKDVLVSIIVPVFNKERYLENCLKSILLQTYKRFELLLIDDGSSDKSGMICDEYKKQDKRISVIHKENEGVSICRNLGIEMANGRFVFFIDADDYIYDDYIEQLVKPMLEESVDISICGFFNVYRNKIVKKSIKKDRVGKLQEDYSILPHNSSCLQGPVCKCYKKSIIDKYNIRFPSEINYGEDQCFNFQYYLHVNTYKFISKPLYRYYRRGTGTSLDSTYTSETLKDELKTLEFLNIFLEDYNVINKNIIITRQIYQIMARFKYNEIFTYNNFKRLIGMVRTYDCTYDFYDSIKIKIVSILLTKKYYIGVYALLYIQRLLKK